MGGIGAGLAGSQDWLAGQQNDNIQRNIIAGVDAIKYVNLPSINQMKVKLQNLVQQGVLSPQMAQTFLQQATAYNDMDPTARNALTEIVNSQGLDPQARAALHQVQQEQAATERGAREAIMQNAAARGVAGSGLEMANRLSAEQGNATNAANQGFQAAADANNRRLQAISGLGTMDSQKAAAQDAINQFNAANRQSVENMNVGAANSAAEKNLAEKQRIADTNVQTANQQQLYNKGLYQQDFANQMAKQSALANAWNAGTQANTEQYKAKAGISGGEASKWSDKNLKTDVDEVDPKEMLDNLTGYSYNYKEGLNMDDGPQVGIMAQDLEKSAPQAVINTKDGKQIDYSRLGGPILAALSSLNERLNEMESENENEGD